MSNWQHFRDNRDHQGTQDDTTVLLSGPIGKYAAGATVHSVLADMVLRIQNLESSAPSVVRTFTINAFILPTFRLNAVKLKAQSSSFTINARLARGSSATIDAILKKARSGSMTIDAALV